VNQADAAVFRVQDAEKVRVVQLYARTGLAEHGQPFTFLVSTIAPGASNALHKHSCDEIMFLSSGAGMARVGDRSEQVGRNSLVHAPRETWHQLFNTSDEPMTLQCLFVPPLPEEELAVILGQARSGAEGGE
jgi:mannose-6-phosphate isomerase-like protein (cupin superfamily)